ncbi:MAG: VWA domain-containing protein [Mycobacterium sp.]
MTNPNLTLIAALLDRSGSMERCKTATETGFDEIISKHRSEPGEAIVTLSMFDDRYDTVYANVPIAAAPPLTLVPRNMTAVLDAIGCFITEIGEHLASQNEADRPGTVICLIMTDGYENASKEWSYDSVKALITQQREQYDWSFLFLGANIDAVDVGGRIGVPRDTSMTYNADDSRAVAGAYSMAGREMSKRRAGDAMSFSEEDRREASRGRKSRKSGR